MSDRITWLIPVKNGMPHLPETLASIETQTYRNWEVLVWDNGSTDGTLDELRSWIPSRLPGRLVHNRPLSLGNSLASLVEAARTELCARIDADDINYPERLERQLAFLRARPEVILVGTDVEFIDDKGSVIPGAWTQQHEDAEIRWRLRWQCTFGHPTVLFRRSAVIAAGNYSDCTPYEDHDLWLRMALIGEMANLPAVLVKYRWRTASVSGQSAEQAPETPSGRVYDALFDKMAVRNADILFSGIAGTDALELRHKVNSRSTQRLKVTLSDVVRFQQAATASALAVNKPPSYFRRTQLYSGQQRFLLRRILEQNACGRTCLPAIREIQSWFGRDPVGR
jgi:glycosyltransferase involved in cell wall biosynthesis